MATIAIDFDGVIHQYSKGWHTGEIYDKPIPGAFESIQKWMNEGHTVFIFTARKPRQIKDWLNQHIMDLCENPSYIPEPEEYSYPKYGFTAQVIPFWIKWWNKKNVLGITRRKLPAMVYIDDRAVKFSGSWEYVNNEIEQARQLH